MWVCARALTWSASKDWPRNWSSPATTAAASASTHGFDSRFSFRGRYLLLTDRRQVPERLEDVYALLETDSSIGAVVVGLDSGLTYPKVAFATHQVHFRPS